MGYRLLVCGGRNYANYEQIKFVLDKVHTPKKFITLIINGAASGADALSTRWAMANNVPVAEFPAKWDNIADPDAVIRTNSAGKLYDVRAGMLRNKEMLAKGKPHGVVAFHGGRGTANMIKLAQEAGIVVQEFP